MRLWGGLKCVTVVKLTFSKTFFRFFHLFKHPLFRAVHLSKMRLSLVRGATFRSLMPIFGPLWGGCPEGGFMSKTFVLLKEFDVCFYKHQFYLRCFILFGLGWPLGRLWGLGPPPGDLFWISLVASLVLEALWGPFWVHLCPFWSAFTAFRHPMGSYFLNFKHNSDLT